MPDRTVSKKLREASGRRAEDGLKPVGRLAAHALGRDVRRPLRQKAVERIPRDEPAFEQHAETLARARDPQLREYQGHIGVGSRLAGEDAQRLIEGVFDETRHLRLVGQVEAGIEIGLERKLAQE